MARTVTVHMKLGATVTGRLIDTNQRPRVGVALEVWIQPKRDAWSRYSDPEGIITGRQGRFRVESLLTGYKFRLYEPEGNSGDISSSAATVSAQARPKTWVT